MTTDTQSAPTDAEIEALAVEHEAFGFGRVDARGLTTHGFDPDGLGNFSRAVLAKWGTPAPVGVEPVFAFRRKGLDDFCTCTEERYAELSAKPNLFETRIFYTTPPTQAAPSVLEDAGMLDWLEARGTVAIERCKYLGSDNAVIEVTPYNDDSYEGDTLRDAIRAAMAAKKGDNHD